MPAGSGKKPSEGSRRIGTTATELPVLSFATTRAWSAWLAAHHDSSRGVWLKIAKKGVGSESITYAQAIDVALGWGWIDSQKGKLDEAWWLQRFTPRKAKSPWSKINRAKAEALIATGAMQAPGLAEVERAKHDGRWKRAYDGAGSSVMPADLTAAFARNARALAFFEALDGANRYAILYRVQTAKKPETRAERISRFVALCARHETIHERRQTKAGSPVRASKKARAKIQGSTSWSSILPWYGCRHSGCGEKLRHVGPRLDS